MAKSVKGVQKNETKHVHKKGLARERKCQVASCKAEYRSKGYCDRHFRMWRKGEFGDSSYSSCNKEGCGKPMGPLGLCDEHRKESGSGGGGEAPAAA